MIAAGPDSPDLIAGVRVQPFAAVAGRPRLFPGSRAPGPRAGRRTFRPKRTQVSAALNYPGAIKAFHYPSAPDRLLDCGAGHAAGGAGGPAAGLADVRTCGTRSTSGALRPWQILIPPGVGHGYKVIGTAPAHAGLPDRPLLQSRRTKAASPTTIRGHQLRLGDCSTSMKADLVTGGAGFIGSRVRPPGAARGLGRRAWSTSTSSPTRATWRTWRAVEADPRYRFVHGDICDAALVMRACWRKSARTRSCTSPPNRTSIAASWAPERVLRNQSARHVHAARSGAGRQASPRFVHVSTDEVYGSIDGAARRR